MFWSETSLIPEVSFRKQFYKDRFFKIIEFKFGHLAVSIYNILCVCFFLKKISYSEVKISLAHFTTD